MATAQGSADLGESLELLNPSFEDSPRRFHPPTRWYDCSFSGESAVDVHPASALSPDSAAFFGVSKKAFDGNTYLGMVTRDNDTYEAVSQRIKGGPLKAGKCYTFSIYLATSEKYISKSQKAGQEVNFVTPVKLRIFGGISYCNRGEIIAESAPVKNNEWLQYNFRFEPKKDHKFIVLEAYYKTPVLFPYNGNLLLDAAGKIVPIPCDNTPPEAEEEEEDDILLAEVPTDSEAPISTRPNKTTSRPKIKTGSAPVKQKLKKDHKKPNYKLQGLSKSQLRAGSVVRVSKLFFKADSSAITDISKPILDEIYQFLDLHQDVVIEIGGHTNNIPPHSFCDKLSYERAKAVVEYLIARGIEPSRLYPKGYGKRKPVATNKTRSGRKRNQRVEIKVLSIG